MKKLTSWSRLLKKWLHIYDRYDVKRCLNCQKFGHFARDCPDKNVKVCCKCSGNHYVNDCDSFQPKCINCVRNNLNIVDHEENSSPLSGICEKTRYCKK